MKFFRKETVSTTNISTLGNNVPTTPHLPDDMPTPTYEQPDDGTRSRKLKKAVLGIGLLAVVGTVAALTIQSNQTSTVSASVGSAYSSGPQHGNQGAPSNVEQLAKLDSLADISKLVHNNNNDGSHSSGPQRANQKPIPLAYNLNSVSGPQHGNRSPPRNYADLARFDSLSDIEALVKGQSTEQKGPQRANQKPGLPSIDNLDEVLVQLAKIHSTSSH